MIQIKKMINKDNDLFTNRNVIHCVNCGSINVVGNGNYKNRKRYKCKDCQKSFNDLSGTVGSYIQDKEKFLLYAREMLTCKSLRRLANDLEISLNTSLVWKHKILNKLQDLNKNNLLKITSSKPLDAINNKIYCDISA